MDARLRLEQMPETALDYYNIREEGFEADVVEQTSWSTTHFHSSCGLSSIMVLCILSYEMSFVIVYFLNLIS